MIDTVVSVKPRDGKFPGRVKFSGDREYSTFIDEVIEAAAKLVGQRAEFETETKGKYTNLTKIKPAGGQEPHASGAPIVSFEGAAIASQLKRIADNVEKLVAGVLRGDVAGAAPRAAATQEQQLADRVGADAAKAMTAALRAKHGTDAAAFAEALTELLRAHGVA